MVCVLRIEMHSTRAAEKQKTLPLLPSSVQYITV